MKPDNDMLRALCTRRSVRAFAPEPVSDTEKEAVFKAAMRAPTAGNQMMYTILDITDAALKARLAELCDHQPFIAAAPVALVFLADCQRWYDGFAAAGCAPRAPRAGDLLLAVADAVIAAQSAVVAAESLGLGCCYIGDILENCEAVRGALELPPYVMPAAMVVMGRPAQQQKRALLPRFGRRYIVRENRYRRMSGAEHEAMVRARAGERPEGFDYAAWMQRFCARKYNSAFSQEMSRSAEVYLKAFCCGETEGAGMPEAPRQAPPARERKDARG